MAKQYLNFKATNPITGCPMGSFCTPTCSETVEKCPLYKALIASPLLSVSLETSATGDRLVNVGFPESYGDVLIHKEYQRFSNIATQCRMEKQR